MARLDDAIQILDTALTRLEQNISGVSETSGNPDLARREVEILMTDRDRLARELDASLARENELQTLADEASVALGSAIAEVRAALEKQGNSADG